MACSWSSVPTQWPTSLRRAGTWGAEMGCAESATPHAYIIHVLYRVKFEIRTFVTDSSNIYVQVTGMRIGSRVGVPLANP